MLKKIFSSYIVLSVLVLCYALFSYFTKEGIEQLLFVIIGFLSFVAALSFLLLPLETPSKSYVLFYSTAFFLILISILALNNPIIILTYWKGIIVLSLFHFVGIITLKFLFNKGKFWQYILIFNSLFFVGMSFGIFFSVHTMLYFTTVGGFFLVGSLCMIMNLLHKIKVNIKH